MRCLPGIAGFSVLAVLQLASQPARAMQFREDSAVRHDRFTGFPNTPAWSESAWFDSRAFAGVGWRPSDPEKHRQFALVSPRHLVFASHFLPSASGTIRFLSTDGTVIDRTIASNTKVLNDLGQPTDLALIRLSTPLLAADKVPHFPYLNLSGEEAFQNVSLTIFGWQARAGRGRIAGFANIEEPPVNLTRACRFDYRKNAGFGDECYLEIGDSGSPSFATVNGSPALVGVHTTVGEDALTRYNFDTFVPHYADKLNLLMAPDGYQMTPTSPPPAALSAVVVRTPDPWRLAMAATCRIDLTNTGPATATNVNAVVRFPASQSPATLDAPGWIVTNGAPGEFVLNRATLAANATVSLTATWTGTGATTPLPIQLDQWADGIAVLTHDFTTELAPSYQAWAAGLAQPAPEADGDGDGLANLLEYAFGGDPATPSRFQPDGVPLDPRLSVDSGQASVTFPVREDAEIRGLTYQIEFSSTLGAGSWSADPPPGFTFWDETHTPDVPGFLRRTATFDATGPRIFCRVRVELDEDG